MIPTNSKGNVTMGQSKGTSGFSMLELLIIVTLSLIVGTFGLLQLNGMVKKFRASSDVRSIASQLALAKMRAANSFTQSRLNCDLTANSCQLEVCTTKGASTCTTFSSEGGPLRLSQDIRFGFGSISTAAGTQGTIQNTAQILFNSRGIPVNDTGAPIGTYGLYLTNQAGDTYAVTVYATGRVAMWQYTNGTWTIQ